MTTEPIEATPENMRKYTNPDRQLGFDDLLAYSPTTAEEYSANPGDYWANDPTLPLVDSNGEPMFLVRKVTRMEPV